MTLLLAYCTFILMISNVEFEYVLV